MDGVGAEYGRCNEAVTCVRAGFSSHDELDRLVWAESASYAPNNSVGPAGLAYTYDAIRVHALTSTSDGRSFTYDGNGNTQTDGQRTMTWDANHQVLSVALGGTTTTFAYDGAGARVTKTSSGNTLAYVGKFFECVNPSGTTTPTCSQWTRYIYAGSTRIAQVVSGGTPAYYESDHLGSTRVLSGAQTGTVTYQPFGLATSDSTGVRYKFTGQEWDAETGSTTTTRASTIRSWGGSSAPTRWCPASARRRLNRYAYVLNNPLRYVDPMGHQTMEVCLPECPKQKSDPPPPPDPRDSSGSGSLLSDLWHGILSALNGNGDPVGPPSWSTEELVGQLNSAMSVGASLVPLGSPEVFMSPCPSCRLASATSRFSANAIARLIRLPDYGSFNIDLPYLTRTFLMPGLPSAHAMAGSVHFTLVFDPHDFRVYVGTGVNLARAGAPFNVGLNVGWLLQTTTPTGDEIAQSTLGRGWSIEGGNGVGMVFNNNEGATNSVELGFTTPYASASYTQMWELTEFLEYMYWRAAPR